MKPTPATLTRLWAVAVLLVFAGCAGEPRAEPLANNHPANPAAAEAPPPTLSQTLAVREAPPATAPESSMATMHDMQHMGHGMGGMQHDVGQMQHDMKGMQQEAPTTRPGENAAPSAPTLTPTSHPATTRSAAVYTCPMHPEVVSDRPGNCPKCGTKLVKKGGA
jgi:hypothetical protein